MKKILLSTVAVCGLAMTASPAQAQLSVDLGGYFKGYGFWTNQDESPLLVGPGAGESRSFDIIRNTEIHMGGETTLDNGLTVGMHVEAEADGSVGSNDSFDVNESYAYFSGGWGRVNFGSEDGAAYLLQVEAPSADANIDGLRQFVNPVNYQALPGVASILSALNVGASGSTGGLDYDQDVSANSDKITYLSPVMNGFQVGASFTPDVADVSNENALNFQDVDGAFGSVWDLAARYEGQFNNVGVIVGAGYTRENLEDDTTVAFGLATGDRTAWNGGVDLDIGPFGLGAAYMRDDRGDRTGVSGDERTWVVGADYTTGPFKLGVSYLDQDNSAGIIDFAGTTVDAKRITGGVVYTYGPGMTFRGSVSRVNLENVDFGLGAGEEDLDATSVVVGTQINF